MHTRTSLAAAVTAALVLSACDSPTEPGSEAATAANAPLSEVWSCYDDNDPHCLPLDPDPSPKADGVFLGPGFDPDMCETSGDDLDLDGVGDFCEYQLALSFRPLLATNLYDQYLARESYWAVTSDGRGAVRILYMFGYYGDGGKDCPVSLSFCNGHIGDSEFVVAYVQYDYATQHWVLERMFLSAHWDRWGLSGHDNSQITSKIEFPDRDGHYPLVWVSLGKHANYRSKADCHSHTVMGFQQDECGANSPRYRFDVSHMRNVGSSAVKFIDVTSSSNPARLGLEQFWADVPFCGWGNPGPRAADSCSTSYYWALYFFENDLLPSII